ncbi:hypothetical protein [Thauera sp.]|uniref:hypothetical protein n=1 Tax=Thauera sp. TaxID=1905334 RepID=UPI0026250FFA|nr:hypothetical protein [Thauera sp.]
MSTNTRSALRASLKQEDAALDERLPDAASPSQTVEAPVVPTAAKPAPKRAQGVRPKPPARPRVAKASVATASVATAPAAGAKPAGSAKPAAPPASPAAATAPKVAQPASAKAEKRSRESFGLVASDLARLDRLRAALKTAGRPTRKSELVRAGLVALAALGTAETIVHLDALPARARPAAKSDKKKSAAKGKAGARKR